MLRFSDARNFGRTLTGLCLISALVIFLVSAIISPNTDHDNKTRELAAVAAHKGSYLTSAYLFLAGGILVMIAAVGLIRFFRGPRGVTAGQVGAGLLLIGAADLFAFFAFTITEYDMVNEKGLNRPALAQFLDKANDSSVGFPLFIVFLLGVVLGLILLGVAMYRTRAVPRRPVADRARHARLAHPRDVRRGVGLAAGAEGRGRRTGAPGGSDAGPGRVGIVLDAGRPNPGRPAPALKAPARARRRAPCRAATPTAARARA